MSYIGGKTLLLNNILETIQKNCDEVKTITDVFSGSGVVGKFFKENGYNVISNDFLYFSYILVRGTIGISSELEFDKLECDDVVEFLNKITLDDTKFSIDDCFIYNNYSPNEQCERMYFQNDNAIKTIRTKYLLDGTKTKLHLPLAYQEVYNKIIFGERLSGREKETPMFQLLHSFWTQIKEEHLLAANIFKMLKKIYIKC